MSNNYTDHEILAAYAEHGSYRKAGAALGIPKSTFGDRYVAIEQHMIAESASIHTIDLSKNKNSKKRFIFTAAQDDTDVHVSFLENLKAYAALNDADIYIGGFTYNKKLFENHDVDSGEFREILSPYMTQNRYKINNNLVFCGEMNTLPTAVKPLSGLETYTKNCSGIFPHAKVQLASVPTMKSEPAKILMTTGAVTLPNYVKKKAGIKASFHHVLGAVFVEIDKDGDHFCRHLLAEEDGSFCDLQYFVSGGEVSNGDVLENNVVEAINWGDIHAEQIDETVYKNAFENKDSILNSLRPKYQLFHDTMDFYSQSHHKIKDPHEYFRAHLHKHGGSIQEDLKCVANFLKDTSRELTKSIIVHSNHDEHLKQWLKTADYRSDPQNAMLFLDLQREQYSVIEKGLEECFDLFVYALGLYGGLHENLRAFVDMRFLSEDESFKIAGDVECGVHGHAGANGSRGSPLQFTKMGSKANTGHTHSASIIDGIYTAGTCSKLDMGYNKGLSSWSHSHIITYKNGKRTIITMKDGKWRA